MPSLDDEIDQLYQLPLGEFTPARNALVKQAGAGAERAAIRTLQKPSLAAWAVNQLYWRRRKAFDRLAGAAERLRAAHGKRLAGKTADLQGAETAHQAALKAAAEEIRGILTNSGETASPATMTAVTETLQALPGREAPGRLTRPLRPLGFEALAGLVRGVGAAPKRVAEVVSIETGRPVRAGGVREASSEKRDGAATARAAEAARREAQARKRDAANTERRVRAARDQEREAAAALAKARQALARAERDHNRMKQQLEDVTTKVQVLAEDVRRRQQQSAEAVSERARLEQLLASLTPSFFPVA